MQRISLPIDPYLNKITEAYNQHDNLILTAPPGSGKTTRVPAELLKHSKKTIVLVPRRIAALSAANRIAEENNLNDEVGYQVRFENRTTPNTKLIFMTEGVFIKKINDPKMWQDLETIIFDEFHERSSHIDLALGIALEKQILGEKVKLIVMSATLNTKKLEDFLPNHKTITVEDKPYPLELIKSKKAQRLQVDQTLAETINDTITLAKTKSKKDILIFLPGLSEIRFIERNIKDKNFEINILHGSVKLEEQKRILQPSANRRIILSTNVAESSITIPSIDCVIDTGLEKKAVAETKLGFKRLETNRISLFSAKQRAGRSARTGPGTTFQLWHEADERSMPEQILPEILTSDLLEESLTLLSLGIDNPDQFSWLDKPKKKFTEAINQLKKWDLIHSEKGKLVQSAPLDIERSLLFTELSLKGHQKQAATLLAYLETTNFDKQNHAPDLYDLQLTDQGKRIESQLNQLRLPNKNSNEDFRTSLIKTFFHSFPNRIAKRKSGTQAVSSNQRGLEMAPYLVTKDSDYYLLLNGRELNSATTFCDFAIGFTKEEFEELSREATETKTEIHFDAEKKKLYKIEKKYAGNFVITESAKSFLTEAENKIHLKKFLTENLEELLSHHPDYNDYNIKLNFLKKKTEHDFNFDIDYASVTDSMSSIEEFFDFKLYDYMLYATPEDIQKDLKALPDSFTLPTGKVVKVDYESDNAPKISARIQELYSQKTNPTVLNGKIRMTIELLAPNYRPTQITSQLENFWKTSYFEIRKELKARYPKHAWPDDPENFKPEARPQRR